MTITYLTMKSKKHILIFIPPFLILIYVVLLVVFNSISSHFYIPFVFSSFIVIFASITISLFGAIENEKNEKNISIVYSIVSSMCLLINVFVVVAPIFRNIEFEIIYTIYYVEEYGTPQKALSYSDCNINWIVNEKMRDLGIQDKCLDYNKEIYYMLINENCMVITDEKITSKSNNYLCYHPAQLSEVYLYIYGDGIGYVWISHQSYLKLRYFIYNQTFTDLLFKQANEIINSFLESKAI